MTPGDIAVFALQSDRAFGERVAASLGLALSDHEERDFEDGEHKARPLVNLRGRDAFVIQALHGDAAMSVNDKLCRLLFFIGALRDASAARITAVIPYLCYARKDRRTKTRDPVITRYVAEVLEAVGVDRVVTLDVHNLAAFQNAFRCRTDHLEARPLLVKHFTPLLGDAEIVVVSPDSGGVKRAERFREAMAAVTGKSIANAFMEKRRSAGVVSGAAMVGDIAGRMAIIVDDLISTGTTMARAAAACKERGATKVYVAATHGLFTGAASEVIADAGFERVVVTDTVPAFRLNRRAAERVTLLESTDLFAEAIKRVHSGGSIVNLNEVV